MARESRLEGKWGVTRVSDYACVTPWKSRAQFLPNYHPTVPISQFLPWMRKATRLTHSQLCGSWKPRLKEVYIQDLSQSSPQKRLPHFVSVNTSPVTWWRIRVEASRSRCHGYAIISSRPLRQGNQNLIDELCQLSWTAGLRRLTAEKEAFLARST